jgi:hypothetical protein
VIHGRAEEIVKAGSIGFLGSGRRWLGRGRRYVPDDAWVYSLHDSILLSHGFCRAARRWKVFLAIRAMENGISADNHYMELLLNKFHNVFGEIREDDSSFLQTLWG